MEEHTFAVPSSKMITVGSGAFKPYHREPSSSESANQGDTVDSQSSASATVSPEGSPPKTVMPPHQEVSAEMLTQLTLLANLKNLVDADALASFGLGELANAAQAAASMIAQNGGISKDPPNVLTNCGLNQSNGGSTVPQHSSLSQPANIYSTQYTPSTTVEGEGGGVIRQPHTTPSTSNEPYSRLPIDDSSKGKRKRTTFTPQQALLLEKEYEQDQYMPRSRRIAVADALNLTESQIKTWFQNRRAKDKKARINGDDIPSNSPPSTATIPVQRTQQQSNHQPVPIVPSSIPSVNTMVTPNPYAMTGNTHITNVNPFNTSSLPSTAIQSNVSKDDSEDTNVFPTYHPSKNIDMSLYSQSSYPPLSQPAVSLPSVADLYSQLSSYDPAQLASMAAMFNLSTVPNQSAYLPQPQSYPPQQSVPPTVPSTSPQDSEYGSSVSSNPTPQ